MATSPRMHAAERPVDGDCLVQYNLTEQIDITGDETDRQDMARMGKTQQMPRRLDTVAIFGFCILHSSSWVAVLSTAPIGLLNGGKAGLIYSSLASWVGWSAVYTSMAELVSIAPTAGAMYHWVSELAPRRYQRILSYIVGWLSALGWQAGVSFNVFIGGHVLQSLVALHVPSYDERSWHAVLLAAAFLTAAFAANYYATRQLSYILRLFLFLSISGFVATIASLLSLRKMPAPPVWGSFTNPGWPSQSISVLVGLLATSSPFLGSDAAAHMAEELMSASHALPRAIILSVVFNGAMIFTTCVSLCYCIRDVNAALATQLAYPFVGIFHEVTHSLAAATAMGVYICLISWCSCFTIMAGASRQLFALARDKAVPFSDWIEHIHAHERVPRRAICCVFCTGLLIEMVGIAGAVALGNVAGLGSSALCISCLVSIACLVWQKSKNASMVPGRLRLGSIGFCCNIVAMAWLCIIFIWGFFPSIPIPLLTVARMNWSSAIWTGVLLFGIAYFLAKGRKRYVRPVELVTRRI